MKNAEFPFRQFSTRPIIIPQPIFLFANFPLEHFSARPIIPRQIFLFVRQFFSTNFPSTHYLSTDFPPPVWSVVLFGFMILLVIPYLIENFSRRDLGIVQHNRILFSSRSQLLSGKQKLDIEFVSVQIENPLWGIVLIDWAWFISSAYGEFITLMQLVWSMPLWLWNLWTLFIRVFNAIPPRHDKI